MGQNDPTRAPERRGLRVVSEEEGSPYPKASLLLRGAARLIDLAVAYGLYRIAGPAGVVTALLYLLFADGMFQGQSVGKRLCGVKVIYLPTRAAARYRDSVLRNAPFGLVMILGMMPDLGDKAFVAGTLVIGGVEAFKVVRDALGIRLGDVWAQTQVIDGKVVAGHGILSAPDSTRAAGRVMRGGNGLSSAPRDKSGCQGPAAMGEFVS
ncbi:MAG: RDD family protein [Myxococcota bacterium]